MHLHQIQIPWIQTTTDQALRVLKAEEVGCSNASGTSEAQSEHPPPTTCGQHARTMAPRVDALEHHDIRQC
jgi:hypothetical protein